MEIELAVGAAAGLGEGPVWDPSRAELLWVDIASNEVHRLDPSRGVDEVLVLTHAASAVVPRAGGGAVAAVADGFAFLDLDTGVLTSVAQVPPGTAGKRMNDGACDSLGRFWAGSIADEGSASGILCVFDPTGDVVPLLYGVSVSNGLGWSPDGRLFYYIDSATRGIDVFACDLATCSIRRRRRLVTCPPSWGIPDGLAIDALGNLWVAFFGGWALRHISPLGAVLQTVEMPAQYVTSCAFGGDDYSDLFVTTASQRLSPEEKRAQPLAGSVFRLRVQTPGLPTMLFGG
jgi:sugar lactone lactonase YvrE